VEEVSPRLFYAQTVLFPHLPYRLYPLPFFEPSGTTTPGAVVLLNPKLDTYPFPQVELERMVAEAERRGEVEHLSEGFVLLRPK
jgi:hypothetical protein